MIVWVKKEAVNMPCHQRATVEGLTIIDDRYKKIGIRIKLLGDNTFTVVKPKDIIGVEILENLTLQFQFTNYSISE